MLNHQNGSILSGWGWGTKSRGPRGRDSSSSSPTVAKLGKVQTRRFVLFVWSKSKSMCSLGFISTRDDNGWWWMIRDDDGWWWIMMDDDGWCFFTFFLVGLMDPSGPLGVEDAIYRITSAMEQQILLEMACGIDDLRLELGSNLSNQWGCNNATWCNHVSPPKCRFRLFS